jgi:hypothetical protein
MVQEKKQKILENRKTKYEMLDKSTKEELLTKNMNYLFIYCVRFQTSYNNCIKEAGTPQQLNTNYSGPFTKYQYKYRKLYRNN